MKKISDTPEHEVFVDYFKGKQMRITRSKATGECFFNADDVAVGLGYRDHNHMMQDPEVLAISLEHEKTTGKRIFTERKGNNKN